MYIKQLHWFHWERLSIKNITNILDNVLQVDWCYSYSLLPSKPSQILETVNTSVFQTLWVDIFTAVSLRSVGGSWASRSRRVTLLSNMDAGCWLQCCASPMAAHPCVATLSFHIARWMEVPKSVQADAQGLLKPESRTHMVSWLSIAIAYMMKRTAGIYWEEQSCDIILKWGMDSGRCNSVETLFHWCVAISHETLKRLYKSSSN